MRQKHVLRTNEVYLGLLNGGKKSHHVRNYTGTRNVMIWESPCITDGCWEESTLGLAFQ